MSGEPTGNPRAAYVLAGGRSSRMGRDKALLPVDGTTLIDRIASLARAVTNNVTIIAPPDRYRDLPYPVIADMREACGPLGGLFTALSVTTAPWNLIVACDMPALTVPFLENLFEAAEASEADAVIPESPTGLDPLCAIYHRRSLAQAAIAIDRKILKMHDFVSTLHFRRWPVSNAAPLENVNTPEEWAHKESAR
jgi:molybdenum cofactor guanylyltransferase